MCTKATSADKFISKRGPCKVPVSEKHYGWPVAASALVNSIYLQATGSVPLQSGTEFCFYGNVLSLVMTDPEPLTLKCSAQLTEAGLPFLIM
jgi:hypothetical protein